jgi:hypothetical protein
VDFDPTFSEGTLFVAETRIYGPLDDPLDPDGGTVIDPDPTVATVRRVPTP